jgi:hypothetical protein
MCARTPWVDVHTDILWFEIQLLTRAKMEKSKQHIRHCLLFLFQSGKSAAKSKRSIWDVIAPDAVSIRTTEIGSRDYSLEDKPKSGRPASINLDSLHRLLEKDPSLTTGQLASTLRCSNSAIHYQFTKLHNPLLIKHLKKQYILFNKTPLVSF